MIKHGMMEYDGRSLLMGRMVMIMEWWEERKELIGKVNWEGEGKEKKREKCKRSKRRKRNKGREEKGGKKKKMGEK